MTVHLQMKKTAEIARLKAELHKLETARGGITADGAPTAQTASDAAPADTVATRTGWSRRGQGPKQAAPSAPAEAGARMPRVSDTSQHDQRQTSAATAPAATTSAARS
jgi:hypothetical protein